MTRQWLNGPCLLLGISRISSFRLALQGRFLTRTWDHPMNRAEAAMATQQVTEKRPGKNSNYSSYSNYSNYSNCKKNECQRSRPLHVLRPVSFRTLRKCARRNDMKRTSNLFMREWRQLACPQMWRPVTTLMPRMFWYALIACSENP